jgi:hypothetical protein
MSHKKLLQVIGAMLIIVSLGCGIPAISPVSEAPGAADTPESPAAADTSEAPAATDTPEPPAATNTPKPPTATPTSNAILAVELTEKPVDFGDVQKMRNGEVKIWLGFGGTLKNIGNVTLTDLRVCVDFNYKTTPWEYDCGDVPDLAVGETKKYGAGFYLEGKPETVKDLLEEGSYVITVKSGDNKVGINKATK